MINVWIFFSVVAQVELAWFYLCLSWTILDSSLFTVLLFECDKHNMFFILIKTAALFFKYNIQINVEHVKIRTNEFMNTKSTMFECFQFKIQLQRCSHTELDSSLISRFSKSGAYLNSLFPFLNFFNPEKNIQNKI